MRDNQIYILPTGHGLVFLLSVVFMILSAATYNNNLIYILAFSLFGVLVISMVQTHINLKHVSVESCVVPDVSEASEIVVNVTVVNRARARREHITVKVRKALREGFVQRVDSQSNERVHFVMAPQGRGRHLLKHVQVSTLYPLGLFRAWKRVPVKVVYYVYPNPRGQQPLAEQMVPLHGLANQQSVRGLAHGADFYEHRTFHQGDSYLHVDWKAVARGRPLLIKRFEGESQKAYLFPLPAQGAPYVEAALSQIAKWILEATAENSLFALQGPTRVYDLDAGLNHCRATLRVLAEFGKDNAHPTA